MVWFLCDRDRLWQEVYVGQGGQKERLPDRGDLSSRAWKQVLSHRHTFFSLLLGLKMPPFHTGVCTQPHRVTAGYVAVAWAMSRASIWGDGGRGC